MLLSAFAARGAHDRSPRRGRSDLAVPILMRRSSRASDAAVLEKLSAVGYALRVVGPADFAKIVAQPGSDYGTGRAG